MSQQFWKFLWIKNHIFIERGGGGNSYKKNLGIEESRKKNVIFLMTVPLRRGGG